MILQTITKLVVFIILTLAFYLFFSGSNAPGGGFIGGLVLAAAIILLLLAYDVETIVQSIPLNFKWVAATGALLVVGTGLGSFLFDAPFLTQATAQLDLPILGAFEISSAIFFEAGVTLTVVGVVVTIILTISEDV